MTGLLNFDVLLDHIPESIIVLNPHDNVIFFNKRVKEFEHLAHSAFEIGTSFAALTTPERREIVKHVLRQVKSTKKPQVLDAEYKDPNGRAYFFETIYEPLLNEDDELEFICVIIREKTHEKIFEKKSTQLIQDYANLIENANAVIFSVDSRGYVTDWNTECIRITQYSKNEVLAQKVGFFIEELPKNELDIFLDKILNGIPVGNFELHFIAKDKSVVRILINATPKVNNSGKVVGVLFVGHDITELSKYRQSLEQMVQDRTEKLKLALEKEQELVTIKNRFVSMASHEFRIPLSTISSAVNFIRTNGSLREADVEKLQAVEKQIGHMRAMIDDVLTLGKTEVGKLKASYKKFDLIAFLNGIMEEVMVSAQQTHTIEFQFSHPVIEVESDEKLLRNIFINLLSNAIKFSPERNKVDLVVNLRDDFVEVQVTDQGIGIDETDLAKIFEPFNRGSNTGSIKGTGLGLSIVKKAVEALGGNLAIESKLNKGTSVKATIKK